MARNLTLRNFCFPLFRSGFNVSKCNFIVNYLFVGYANLLGPASWSALRAEKSAQFHKAVHKLPAHFFRGISASVLSQNIQRLESRGSCRREGTGSQRKKKCCSSDESGGFPADMNRDVLKVIPFIQEFHP